MLGSGRRLDRGPRPRACGAASRGKRWLVPLAVFLCLFGAGADPGDDGRGAGAVHLRDLLSAWTRFRELLACPACAGRSRRTGRAAGAAPATRCSTASPPCGCPATRAPRRCGASTSARRFPAIRRATACRRCGPAPSGARSPRLLDRAIPGDARIVEVGCGTGQMCLYLARADRVVVGADLTRASLALGAGAGAALRARAGAVRRDRPAAAGPQGGRLRRRLLVGRPAPHAGSARVVRAPGAAGAARRDDRGRASTTRSRGCPLRLRRVAARLSGFRLDPVRSGPARAASRAGAAGGVAARSVPASRGAPPHARRGAGLVRRERRRVPPRPIRARCSTTSRRSCSRPRPTTGGPRDGWRSWLDAGRSAREGGLFFTVGRRREDAARRMTRLFPGGDRDLDVRRGRPAWRPRRSCASAAVSLK